jgi:AraC family transcriptional regulator
MHRHARSYAALVLEGRYEEISVDGPFVCEPGVLVVHPAHHAHANVFSAAGARVLNIPLPGTWGDYRVSLPRDPSALERLMRRDPRGACEALHETTATATPRALPPWLRHMARLLRELPDERDDAPPVRAAARLVGRSPAHASRAFRVHFGVGPSAYRREFRLRAAFRELRGADPLGEVALAAGFADQSHLGRDLKRATGMTPRQWRLGHAHGNAALRVKSVLDFPAR